MALTDEQFNAILDAIATTPDGLRKICAGVGCTTPDLYRYLNAPENAEAALRYARAKNIQASIEVDNMLEIISEPPPKDENGRTDTGYVQWQKARLDDVKWRASKTAPKKYGDKLEVDGKVELSGPRVIRISAKKTDDGDE